MKLQEITRLAESNTSLEQLRQTIWQRIPDAVRPSLRRIHLCFPDSPPLREASHSYILPRGSSEPRTLNRFFKIDEWLETYNAAHWAGYIFADLSHVDVVSRAALDVLQERGIVLDERAATAAQRQRVQGVAPRSQSISLSIDASLDRTPRLPVLEAFIQSTSAGDIKPLAGLNAILLLHFLTDLPPLLSHLRTLGLDASRTWLIRKPYAYRFGDTIAEQLKAQGYHLSECTAAEDTSEPARRALLDFQSSSQGDSSFVVIEDGGFITPLLHLPMFADLRRRCVGVVEQTTKGLREIKKIPPEQFGFPVVAVASSHLKILLEGTEVGHALAFALEHYLREFVGIPVRFLPILVIGAGTVGTNLARALKSHDAAVRIFDSDFKALVGAKETWALDTIKSLDDGLESFKLIIGTTGTTSLTSRHLASAADEVILASGSSDRLEFDMEGLRHMVAEPVDQNITLNALATQYRLNNGKSVNILCDGYPINFVIGDGIAKSVIDPILTELVAAALLIAKRDITQPGIHDLPEQLEKQLWELYEKSTGN